MLEGCCLQRPPTGSCEQPPRTCGNYQRCKARTLRVQWLSSGRLPDHLCPKPRTHRLARQTADTECQQTFPARRSLSGGTVSVVETCLFDKWHLGPLRLINFALAGCVIAPFLKSLNRWEQFLRPLFLIGRHMLPVFSIEICLSVVLIGRTDPGTTAEPVTSLLVICQLVTAPLLAWLFERRSTARQSARSTPESAAAGNQVNAQSAGYASPVMIRAGRHAHAN
jgi:OpgC protein